VKGSPTSPNRAIRKEGKMYERPELDRDYIDKWIEAEYEIWWKEDSNG